MNTPEQRFKEQFELYQRRHAASVQIQNAIRATAIAKKGHRLTSKFATDVGKLLPDWIVRFDTGSDMFHLSFRHRLNPDFNFDNRLEFLLAYKSDFTKEFREPVVDPGLFDTRLGWFHGQPKWLGNERKVLDDFPEWIASVRYHQEQITAINRRAAEYGLEGLLQESTS